MSDNDTEDEGLVPHKAQSLAGRSAGLVRRGLADAEGLLSRDKMPAPSSNAIPSQYDPWERLRESLKNLQTVEDRLGMKFIEIEAGTFMMGSNLYENEKPIHEVTITKPFYMARYPVTQHQWQGIMGSNPSLFIGDDYPVHCVSWNDVNEFIHRLNLLEAKEARTHAFSTGEVQLIHRFRYRLPNEAEWEYACRAESTTDYAGALDSLAWYANNSGNEYLHAEEIWSSDWENHSEAIDNRQTHDVFLKWQAIRGMHDKRIAENRNRTHTVGTKKSNAFGLYDMHGNVREWCQDFYDEGYYSVSPHRDPHGPSTGELRVLRGGSWKDWTTVLRSAFRVGARPDVSDSRFGFRLVGVVLS